MPGLDPKEWLNWLARNRWVVLGVLLGLLILLAATAAKLGGRPPALGALNPLRSPRNQGLRLDKAEMLLVGGNYTRLLPATNQASPFATDFFKPPPPTNTPPPPPTNTPPPPPPPPPVQKIALLYQGLIEGSTGARLAYLKVGENLLTLTNGASVAGGFILADFTLRTATLQKTNATNVLNFNQPVQIEIPAQ